MSRKLADKLMSASSAKAFFLERGSSDWRTIASLKSTIDSLVGRDLTVAAPLSARVIELADLLGDPLSKAFAAATHARVIHSSGNFSEANRIYQQSAKTLAAAQLYSQAAWIKTHQVYALTQLGRYDAALTAARDARAMLNGADPIRLAQLETNVGTVYYRLDRYEDASRHYKRASKLLERADPASRAFVDFSRSNVLTDTDRPRQAEVLLRNAASAWQSAGLKILAAQARFHIAYLEFLRGNYSSALSTYHGVREELKRLGGNLQAAWCDQEIAEILLALNAFGEAADYAAEARDTFRSLGMQYEAGQATMIVALSNMGLERYELARTDLRQARRIFTKTANQTLTAIADSYIADLLLRQERFADARKRASSAHRVFSRQGLVSRAAQLRLTQARAALSSEDARSAAALARSALKLVKGLHAPSVEYQCHHLIGRIAQNGGRSRDALRAFRRAVKIIEGMRAGVAVDQFKATFLNDKIPIYEDAISACLAHGGSARIREAFQLVESSKSRALAEMIARFARGAQNAKRSGRTGKTAQLDKLLEDLNWYSAQVGFEDDKGRDQRSAEALRHYQQAAVRCETQIARLFRLLEGSGHATADLCAMRTVAAKQLLEVIRPGETLIEYFTTGNELCAFVADSGRFDVVRAIALRSDVEKALAAMRFQFEKFNYGAAYVEANFSQLRRSTSGHLSELHRLIFSRLEPRIRSERLIVIPHSILHYIPFHALTDGNDYLADKYEISTAPSAVVFNLCRRRRLNARADRMVAVGVSERGTPHIDREISELRSLFPNAATLTGSRATLKNFMKLAPEARFLHVASHGYFRRDNPMFSFLKLADSHLNFYSLLELQLNAEMVTLSACHTGVNMIFPGDELHGLMRGFLNAGAPTLVASLWAVSDKSTSDFMREFYTNVRGGRSKRAAIREAQLAVKDAYGHPYYWAPFVLMGNPD